jgi:hypothetical protein
MLYNKYILHYLFITFGNKIKDINNINKQMFYETVWLLTILLVHCLLFLTCFGQSYLKVK